MLLMRISHSLLSLSSSSSSSKTLIAPRFSKKLFSSSSSPGASSAGRSPHRRRPFAAMASKSAAAARASAKRLENVDDLIDSVETFIFDCDGVIWKGDSLIDGVPETLDMLRSKGKRLVFVTNNSTKSRKQYGKKFETLGLSVSEEEIFASSFAAAAYLKSIDFPKDKKVYVIGEDGILKELELAGFQYLGGPGDGDKKIELKPGFLMEHDESVGAVVVGFDRYFNYYKIQWRFDGWRHTGFDQARAARCGEALNFHDGLLSKQVWHSQIPNLHGGRSAGHRHLVRAKRRLQNTSCSLRCDFSANASEPREPDSARHLRKQNLRSCYS